MRKGMFGRIFYIGIFHFGGKEWEKFSAKWQKGRRIENLFENGKDNKSEVMAGILNILDREKE